MLDAIRKLPKTDLHCHLDGSLRVDTILDIARKERANIGTDNPDILKERLLFGKRVESLPQFLQAFDITCAVMQTREALERVAFELAEDAFAENVYYIEVRFAPVLMTKKGLTTEDVVKSVRRGLSRAEAKYPIRTGIIFCALRTHDPKTSVDLAHFAVSLKNEGVVGFDLAHAERGNPAKNHAEAFKIARKGGLGITVHAGEDDGPESIRQAMDDCHAQRIGHGRTLVEDPALERRVVREKITVECCPSSNVQINLTPSFKDHPLKGYLDRGIRVTLNTDNRLLTGITVTDEYIRAHTELGLTLGELKIIALNGFSAAFMKETDKAAMLNKIAPLSL